MTITQRPPIGRSDTTTPTAAQKVVAAMWTLGNPATSKAIAKAAGLGYSTVTPILRTLLANNQAVKTDNAAGPAQWQLTATLPTPTGGEPQAPTPSTINSDPAPPADSTGAPANDPDDPDDPDAPEPADQPGSPHPAHTQQLGDPPAPDTGADPAPDTDTGTASDTGTALAADTSPKASQDAEEQRTARTYRKPVRPRRPKGELRAAVLAVLAGTPEQAFKVSEVCRAIDAANADGTSNKAGAGAVVNALDKLVTSGAAIRVEEAKYATYQASPTGG